MQEHHFKAKVLRVVYRDDVSVIREELMLL